MVKSLLKLVKILLFPFALLAKIMEVDTKFDPDDIIIEPTIEKPMPPEVKKITNAEHLALLAKSLIGQNAAWRRLAPPEYACAEALTSVIQHKYKNFPTELSTILLESKLDNSPDFEYTTEFEEGTIILSPTNGNSIGHCGVFVMIDGKLMIASNDSFEKKWLANYTLDSWLRRYRSKLGLRVLFYKPVGMHVDNAT